jgi:L-malate glycosyltransferase
MNKNSSIAHPSESNRLPRLCFAGPMVGINKGWVVNQGEILADLFSEAGYTVYLTSRIPNRLRRLIDTIRSLIRWKDKFDILILAVYSGPSFIIADVTSRLVKILGKPMIFVLHGGNLPAFSRQSPKRVQNVLLRSDMLVSPSGYLSQFFNHSGFHVRVIPNVLEIGQYPFRYRPRVKPRLLWMRTFETLYYPEMAVYVLEQLRETYPDASLTMAGQDRGLLALLRKLVEEKGLSNWVRFAGFLDMQGKQREFPAHDIFLNTNRVDNMPVSVLEAAAFGLPVVATEVGGIPYLLKNEETGLLVANEDVFSMVKAVQRLLVEQDLASRLSHNGRILAESCAWPVVKKHWEVAFAQFGYDSK